MLTSTQISHEMEWEHIDWLIVNEGEAQQLLDAFPVSLDSVEATMPGNAPDQVWSSSQLLSRLASQPPFKNVNIVCTLGWLGVLAHLLPVIEFGGPQVIYEPGVSTREVRDTTGAGDCWAGYLVAGLMELESRFTSTSNLDIEDVRLLLKRCNQAAGMCVEKNGAMESIPGIEEVMAASI